MTDAVWLSEETPLLVGVRAFSLRAASRAAVCARWADLRQRYGAEIVARGDARELRPAGAPPEWCLVFFIDAESQLPDRELQPARSATLAQAPRL